MRRLRVIIGGKLIYLGYLVLPSGVREGFSAMCDVGMQWAEQCSDEFEAVIEKAHKSKDS